MDIIFSIDCKSNFEQVAEEILNNLYLTTNYSTNIVKQNVITVAKSDLRNIICNCSFDITNIKAVLEDKNLDYDKINIFTSLLEKKKNILLSAALTYYNSCHGEIVTDIEWLLKLVFGTSELKTLKYSLLQIILTTMDNKGEQKSMFDLNKDVLMKMIDALQTVSEN